VTKHMGPNPNESVIESVIEQCCADDYLMAAAPELLECLQEVLRLYDSSKDGTVILHPLLVIRIEWALRKAVVTDECCTIYHF
jgi:hypothetical protein